MPGRIFVTGDCHGDFRKFNMDYFPEQRELDKEDYVIICGDFGGIWDQEEESNSEKYWLKWLEGKSYTTLFIDGNHENFNRLQAYPVKAWNGGLVHEIRPSVLHLMRGQIFEIYNKTFFAFGGASSHDVANGILDPADPDFRRKKKQLDRDYIPYRIRDWSWWEQELPSEAECREARENLEKYNYKVDYIISHCCSSETQREMSLQRTYEKNMLTDFFDEIKSKCEFEKWYFGHYHRDEEVSDREIVLYERIVEL